jgi:TonB family protein
VNKKIIPLLSTTIIYTVIILIFLLISVNLKNPEEELITLGFQTIEEIEDKGALAKIGGTEDILAYSGDIPVITGRTKKSLSPLEKPPYEGGEVEPGMREGYRLAGELSKRKIIHFKKPDYPKNENENTETKLEITANPDGTIKKLSIVKTGGLSFDNKAMEAVREWRFQPLPPNVKQSIQTGIVTIYFEIK